jgi:hypothetical protein
VNKTCLSLLAVAALSCRAWGQKVEVQKPNRDRIVHVETALNHLTVLEMSEPVITVAVGSSAFKVEWRENKVFVEPADANVATNLFVWTASGRSNYELDPAGAVPQMDFAIDQPVIDPPAPLRVPASSADPSPADLLLGATPVRLYGSESEKNRVAVYVTDLLVRGGETFIRYTIRNGTKRAYLARDPQVVALVAPRYRESLYPLANSQLSREAASRLKASGETPVEAAKGEIRSPCIDPGQETTGIIAIKLPLAQTPPTVLRLIFLAGPEGSVSATLVL